MKKLVRLINTRLIVHGCTSVFDIVINVDDCPAIIILDYEDKPHIRINGKEIYRLSEIPDTIIDSKLEILDSYASIILFSKDENKICKAFTDEEYSYMPCISLEDITKLLSYSETIS